MKKIYQKLSAEKNLQTTIPKSYSTRGMHGPFKQDTESTQQSIETNNVPSLKRERRKTTERKGNPVECGHRGKMGHTRRNLFDCLKNSHNMVAEEDTEQAKQARKRYIITTSV
jgi:hypothetical protein